MGESGLDLSVDSSVMLASTDNTNILAYYCSNLYYSQSNQISPTKPKIQENQPVDTKL